MRIFCCVFCIGCHKPLAYVFEELNARAQSKVHMSFVTCVCVSGGLMPHYAARIRPGHVSRVIRFTGVRRVLWASLVCHGNPVAAVPLAMRFSRFVGPDLALFYALARNVHVCIISNGGSRTCAYAHTHKGITSQTPRKIALLQRANVTPRTIISNTIRYVSAICVLYRQITVSLRGVARSNRWENKKKVCIYRNGTL